MVCSWSWELSRCKKLKSVLFRRQEIFGGKNFQFRRIKELKNSGIFYTLCCGKVLYIPEIYVLKFQINFAGF